MDMYTCTVHLGVFAKSCDRSVDVPGVQHAAAGAQPDRVQRAQRRPQRPWRLRVRHHAHLVHSHHQRQPLPPHHQQLHQLPHLLLSRRQVQGGREENTSKNR